MNDKNYEEIKKNLEHAKYLLEEAKKIEHIAKIELDLEDVREDEAKGIRKLKKALDLWRNGMEDELYYEQEVVLPSGKKLPETYMLDLRVSLEKNGIGRLAFNKPLPHRNTRARDLRKYSDFIFDFLRKEIGVHRTFRHVCVIFVHYYDENRPAWIRDVDNHLEKPVIDAVTFCLIVGGDGVKSMPARLSVAVADDRFHTDIYLVPLEQLGQWLQIMDHFPSNTQ